MGATVRGLRNPFRSRLRAGVVVVLLALVTGFLALMVQAALASRDQIARLDARVRTLVELREAGAFGTGGFGGDKPVGEHDFSVETLDRVRATFRLGKKLTKIFVTVDSVANVERVVRDLKDRARFAEVDVVTTPEAVSTARTTLGSLAVASAYGSLLLFAIGAVLLVFVMVLSTRERVRETA